VGGPTDRVYLCACGKLPRWPVPPLVLPLVVGTPVSLLCAAYSNLGGGGVGLLGGAARGLRAAAAPRVRTGLLACCGVAVHEVRWTRRRSVGSTRMCSRRSVIGCPVWTVHRSWRWPVLGPGCRRPWWQPFRRLVRTDARERGLAVRRLSTMSVLVLLGTAVPVGLLASRPGTRRPGPVGGWLDRGVGLGTPTTSNPATPIWPGWPTPWRWTLRDRVGSHRAGRPGQPAGYAGAVSATPASAVTVRKVSDSWRYSSISSASCDR
jgi:hypothetical protein